MFWETSECTWVPVREMYAWRVFRRREDGHEGRCNNVKAEGRREERKAFAATNTEVSLPYGTVCMYSPFAVTTNVSTCFACLWSLTT